MIPICKPLFGEEEKLAVQRPLETGWVVQGPYVKEFEDRFANFVGAPHAIATTSCTSALHLAMAALKVKPGDEVIVPAFTWVSTANVVEYMGATPVFCDVDLRTFNVDVSAIETHVTSRTVGLIAVHLFGLCADVPRVLEIAQKRSLWMVEDAACAFGAYYEGKHAGTFGELGCFSFHPRKSITTGEGGMLTTTREDLAELARSLRDHGASRSSLARHEGQASFLLPDFDQLGYNYRMSDIQGALGCAQMERADYVLGERARRACLYDEMLADCEWLQTPVVPEGHHHGYQSYVCLFRPEEPSLANVDRLHEMRNRLMLYLEQRGIATRQGTHAPVTLDFYVRKYSLRPEAFRSSYLADRLSLALPLYPQMTDEEQALVVEQLRAAFQSLS